MDSKHIQRDYSAHRKSVIRPKDEYVKLEIFSFDPSDTKIYLREDNSLPTGSNCTKTSWKSWTCFKSPNNNPMVFDLKYNALSVGDYRIDLIYEQSDIIHNTKKDTSKDLTGELSIDGVSQEVVSFDGENNIIKRNTIYTHFTDGTHSIKFEVPHNCYFYGAIIRKIVKFVGDNYYGNNLGSEEGNMVLTDCTVTNSDMTKPTELSATVFYDPDFECDESPSGFYIDYHDEVNFYVKDNMGDVIQIFGGYVSSILPDSDRTKLSISCADRLIDGQNKYLLDQMRLGAGTKDLTETGYEKSMNKDFDSYPQALKYLCDVYETTLKSNISKDFTVDGEKFHDGFTITFGSSKKVKKISATNGTTKASKNYIMLRNNSSSSKKQVFTLYDANNYAKKPIKITDYPYMHITYGLGKAKTSYQSKTTEKVDTAETTAGSQKFSKCGVSADKKYLMAIGLPSAGKDSKKGWTKTIFKRKCPHCGSTNLIWDWNWGSGKACNGRYEGGSAEGHIFCISCDADYSVQGYEHISGSKYHMEKISSTVASSKSEAQKLKAGNMSAVPSTAVEVTPDDIFKAITKIAFKYKYNLSSGASTYSAMKKSGKGECWAFSDLIFTEMKKYGVSVKIVQYATNESKRHRSVLYKNDKGQWVDFPYREYGWGTKYNNMLNNTSASKHGTKINEYKRHSIGNAKTSTSTSKTQTTSVTHTTGYDKDKQFQGYLRLTYSTEQSFKAKKYKFDMKFTYATNTTNSVNTGMNLYWVNNTIKKATQQFNNSNLIDYIRSIMNFERDTQIYLHSIQMITPKIDAKKKDDGSYEDVDWYKSDDSTDDQSSCKLNLYQITFDDNKGTEPTELQSCGKSVNSMMQSLVSDAGYYVNMSYGLHRKDDRINFRVINNTTESYTASEGDNNNILSWNSISYSPVGSLFNMSMQVFKDKNNEYHYIDTRDGKSILNYGEQCTIQTTNEVISSKEAYFNAIQSDKFNPSQTYSFTITVPNMPKLRIGDLVKVVANAKKLNSVKEVKSIKVTFDNDKIPRVRTDIGLDELAPDIQLKENISRLRQSAREETTDNISSSATPVTEDIYYEWDR